MNDSGGRDNESLPSWSGCAPRLVGATALGCSKVLAALGSLPANLDDLHRLVDRQAAQVQFDRFGGIRAAVDQEYAPSRRCLHRSWPKHPAPGHRAVLPGLIGRAGHQGIQRGPTGILAEELEGIIDRLLEQAIGRVRMGAMTLTSCARQAILSTWLLAQEDVHPLRHHQGIFQVVDFFDQVRRFRPPAPSTGASLYQTFHSSHER